MIHTIATEYHWAKAEILDTVYLDEAFRYVNKIQKTRIYRLYDAISASSVPQMKDEDRRAFLRGLDSQLRSIDNTYNIDTEPEPGAFDKLKRLLGTKQTK